MSMLKAFSLTQKVLLGVVLALLVCMATGLYISSAYLFAAPDSLAEAERIVIPLSSENADVVSMLEEGGYLKSRFGFGIALWLTGKSFLGIEPGGYRVSKAMSAWDIIRSFSDGPYMKWIVIPEGLRKEQIADLIGDELGWSESIKAEWVTKHTALTIDEIEGVYFPDTYLIPLDEAPEKVADRLRAKFNEKFKPYADAAVAENIKWTTLLRLASVIQREAAGDSDMPLIAGVLWNRLLADQRLEVDATVQYVRDDVIHYGAARGSSQPQTYSSEGSWWSPIKSEDKNIQSPYNTYRNAGLPPHPIDNPGIEAIDAALHPEETECLFYLHDKDGVIHCSKTFEEHKENIEKYLK